MVGNPFLHQFIMLNLSNLPLSFFYLSNLLEDAHGNAYYDI